MHQFQLRDYAIYISNRLYPVYNEDQEEILVVFPEYSSICASIHFLENGRLSLASFWGVIYELREKELRVYYNDEEADEEVCL